MLSSELLAEAMQQIKAHGWYQGALSGPNGEVCAMGAIHKVMVSHRLPYFLCNANDSYNKALGYMSQALHSEGGNYVMLASFNDDRHTTEEDVMLLFKKAVYWAEEIGD
jgi:hypothetical protein